MRNLIKQRGKECCSTSLKHASLQWLIFATNELPEHSINANAVSVCAALWNNGAWDAQVSWLALN